MWTEELSNKKDQSPKKFRWYLSYIISVGQSHKMIKAFSDYAC